MKINWRAVVFGLACAFPAFVAGNYVGRQTGEQQTVDTIFDVCYNRGAVMVDEGTGRAVACMSLHQSYEERLEQKKFEQSLDKRNEA